jgi:hypothetical protein
MGVSTHSIEVNAPLKAVYNQKKEDGGQVVGEVRSVKRRKFRFGGFADDGLTLRGRD